MKKTMFITSVIMVVVMAIALTTSSLAWFSAAGGQTVTTSTMTLEAKATGAEGLLISSVSESGAWYSSINLVSGDQQDNMIPAVPYNYYADETDQTILDALVNNRFISNSVDLNGNFVSTAPQTANTSGNVMYFQKEFWITTVDLTNALYVTPTIAWKNVTRGETTVSGAYAPQSSDPVVYVAVLADKNCVMPADRDPSDIDAERDWEILTIFASTGTATVNFGDKASEFQSESTPKAMGSAIDAQTITSLQPSTTSTTTTTTLAPVENHYSTGAAQAYGEVKIFKVVAWYDGASLINSNSEFSVDFELTFTASHD